MKLAGDLLLTGTPHGTGAFQRPSRSLAEGDVREAWVEHIGTLRNPVAAAALRAAAAARGAPAA